LRKGNAALESNAPLVSRRHRQTVTFPSPLRSEESVEAPRGFTYNTDLDVQCPVLVLLTDCLYDGQHRETKTNYDIWQRTNLWLLEEAFARAATNLALIALRGGKSGDGPGGTKDLVDVARNRGVNTVRLNSTRQCFSARVRNTGSRPIVFDSVSWEGRNVRNPAGDAGRAFT
jgi:hypothetical protein